MENNGTVIVGGGISGLLAAKAALERGEKDVTVFEASKRFGGKLVSGRIDDKIVNMGAEFIDDENVKLRQLAEQLKVPLIPTGEQSSEIFQSPSGRMQPDFLKQYAPIARDIAKLRDAAERDPKLAERMKSMSARELMEEVGGRAAVNENTGFFASAGIAIYNIVTPVVEFVLNAPAMIADGAYNLFTGSSQKSFRIRFDRANRVSRETMETALHAMTKELGATADNITAAQFMSETSPSEDRFLTSTCDFRVDGGTAALTDALKKHLEEKGVKFESGHKLLSLQKDGDDKIMTFETPEGEKTIRSKKTIMALPTYALGKIKGFEFLGLQDNQVQYTKNAKITLKVRPGVKLPTDGANAFLSESECWSPQPGLLTFLYHNEHGESPSVVMNKAMQNYAAAFGMKPDDIFYIDNGKPQAGTFAYSNPGEAPCWSTPNPKNARQMEALFAKMEALSEQGLGFVGTYIPLPDGGVGFMECGAASVERVCDRMFGPVRAQEHEVSLSPELQPQHQHAITARLRAEQANSRGGLGI